MITIEEAIARVPQWRGTRATSVTPLGGGITNLNYRVEIGGEAFAVSISSEDTALLGVDRSRTYQSTLAAGQSGVGPEIVHFLPDDGILVTRFIFGRRPTAQEIARPETLERVVRSFHLYHDGPAFPSAFSPFQTLRAYLGTARAAEAARASESAQVSGALPPDVDVLFERVAAIEAAVGHGPGIIRLCHNDLWESNFIDDGSVIRIIDWEYAGTGDVYFDLANFAMHHTFADAQDEALVRAYFGAVSRAGFVRFKLLKIVAELREAMWAMVAQHLTGTAASGFDCVGYAETHFDRCRQAIRDGRLSAWLHPPAPP